MQSSSSFLQQTRSVGSKPVQKLDQANTNPTIIRTTKALLLVIKNQTIITLSRTLQICVQRALNSMSCFNLELPPPKKAWKTFKLKLQSKLHKLNGSKAINKPKTRLPATNTKVAANSSPFIEQRNKNLPLRLSHQGRRSHSHRRYLFKKKAVPVYIDRLFKEPIAAEVVVKHPRACPRGKDVMEGRASKEKKASGGAADDMWESLALASPLMKGIDQRAEEFIKRFRAEMQFQEMMARRL